MPWALDKTVQGPLAVTGYSLGGWQYGALAHPLQPQLHPQLPPQPQLLPPQPLLPPQQQQQLLLPLPQPLFPQQQHRMMMRIMIQQHPPPKPLLFHITDDLL